MKKYLSILAAVAILPALAFAQTEIRSENAVGYVKLDLPAATYKFSAFQFDNIDGSDVTIAQLFGNDVRDGTKVSIFNGVSYDTFTYIDAFGAWSPSGTNVIERGVGFWIWSPDSTNAYLMGEVPDAATDPVVINEGYNMLANPYPTKAFINDLSLDTVAEDGDVINVLNTNGTYDASTFISAFGVWDNNLAIEPGQGFWYRRKTPGSTNWSESKPYTWP